MRAKELIENVPKPKKGVLEYLISDSDRSKLAQQFPPKFSEFIGHHITYVRGWPAADQPPEFNIVQVVGYACDDAGLEALVVSLDGSTTRPDGKILHITWSLDREAGFKPVSSNDLLAHGWEKIPQPINITAIARFS